MTYGDQAVAFIRERLTELGVTSLGKVQGYQLSAWLTAFEAQRNAQAELNLSPVANPQSLETATGQGASPLPAPKSDALFEAVAGVAGIRWQELTKSARGPLNAAVGELRAIGATPEEVRRRAILFQKDYPQIRLTPSALVKHWASFPNVAPVSPISDGPRLIFEPTDWQSFCRRTYLDEHGELESWAASAISLGWKGMTHGMRSRIAREHQPQRAAQSL